MPALIEKAPRLPRTSNSFATDEARWRAVRRRDAAADGVFVYSVRTTGVYCRPVCAARLARRENVRFHANCLEAERAGFRPCKRCRPSGDSPAERSAALVVRACRILESAEETPRLRELASAVGLSPHHFHRLFKSQMGMTPKDYATAQRAKRAREALATSKSVTAAIYDAGFSSSGRFYEASDAALGMTPGKFHSGGAGTAISYAVGACSLGQVLVATSQRGICAIFLGDDAGKLVRELESLFPRAELNDHDSEFERTVAAVIALVENPQLGASLPLDIRGTAFQQRVWQALRKIPAGSTASYSEIARAIGRPKSSRAVARACATNPLAVAIPCHRVVGQSGDLAGYRWGIERKQELLRRERAATKGAAAPRAKRT